MAERVGVIVLMDEETATSEPRPGERIRLEGYRVVGGYDDNEGKPITVVEKT
jgi:hypothetical protein